MQKAIIFPLRRYLGEVGVELRKTTWPRKADWIASTQVVIGTVLLTGLYLAFLDAMLSLVTHQFGMGK